MDNEKRYKKLVDAYKAAYPDLSAQKHITKAQEEWNRVKKCPDDYEQLYVTLKAKAAKRKSKTIEYWTQLKKKKNESPPTSTATSTSQPAASTSATISINSSADVSLVTTASTTPIQTSSILTSVETSLQGNSTSTVSIETPSQDRVKQEISTLESKITSLTALKESGFATEENVQQLKDSRFKLKKAKQKLKYLISDAEKQLKRRAEKKNLLMELSSQSKSNMEKLRKFSNDSPGRRPLEDLYPDLHDAIVALATAGAGADLRRRTDVLNACRTLDDLHAGMLKEGYVLSRKALYLRLIPRRADSTEGKLHVRTVPVKIRKAKNNLRNKHQDSDFTFSTKKHMHDIVSLFGADSVFVISIDDKAKVPIGVTAATKQAPLIMHVSYEIRLPDHDFVKATKHKLTPSVYAGCQIRSSSAKVDPEISYSGPTYIAIRSGKHDSSTAYSHGYDLDHVIEMEEFKDLVKLDGVTKPIAMIFCDGGPDENPRFPKTLDVAIQHFKEYDLDALLISTHAPGMSAYNHVERRMAPLSRALSGLLIPHDTCGTHLDSQRRTTDVELEKRNFKAAADILAEVWGDVVLDKFPVVGKYGENSSKDPVAYDERWVSRHCRVSQYLLQIVKCTQDICCGNFRTNWVKIFPDRFLPSPVPVRQTGEGPIVPPVNDAKSSDRFADLWKRVAIGDMIPETEYDKLPYDLYCPSIKSQVKKRVCKKCSIYHPSIAAVKRHKSGLGCVSDEEDLPLDLEDSDADEVVVCDDIEEDVAPLVDLYEILQNSTFVEEDVDEEN